MKKELTALCVAIIALNGCSGSDSKTEPQATEAFGTQSSALFGELGGDPWGSEAALEISEAAPIPGARFGRALAVGTINGNAGVDIVSSTGDEYSHGMVVIKWDNAATPATFKFTDSETDNFGADIAVGKFCPASATYDPAYDMVIASAPGANEFKGGFAIIHKRKANNSVAILKKFDVNASGIELAGMHIAVGDVDGDGKADLVYQSTPYDGENWLPPKVNVVLDICNRANNAKLTPNASVEAVSGNNLLGSALYIADLDGEGKPEIIAVDENYYDSANTEFSANGAIFFYRFVDGKLVESRKPIIGGMNEKSAAQISSVAFADIDGDGDLDLIVGEPMLNTTAKREGRVRTYTNAGAGKSFDTADMKWSAVSGRSHARFGMSVTVSDVNSDGVPDLIVGAPGFRKIGDSKEYSPGYVYVFMGTKDGSIFSKDPFWTYVSPVDTELNDSFGYRVAAADIDKKAGSWHDLIVAAPGAGADVDNLDAGRISVFSEPSGFCYTANRCLVNGACYEKNEVSEESKCMVCDPTEDNFGFVELKCSGAETECQNTAVCDPVEGCVMTNKPDGTECGEISCDAKSNSLSEKLCKSGVCEENLTECGNYVCDASLASCPVSCVSDVDCIKGYVCDAGVCSESACSTDADCPAGFVCNNGVCEEFKCQSDADCPAGSVCNNGVCEVLECQNNADCENGYVCENGSCVAFVCQSDADCENGYVCENGSCVSPANLPPVITLAESMSVYVGGSVNLKATVTDPEGDDLEYKWSCTSSSGFGFGISNYNTNSATLTVSEKETVGNTFNCTLEVTDAAGNVVTADTLVTVEKSGIVITVPSEGDVYYDTHVTFSGTANVKGTIRVMEGNKLVCMGSVLSTNKWSCQGNLTYGEHTVKAVWSTNASQASEPVTFEIVEDILNHPPIIIMTTEYFTLPGSSVILDASASYDPDGDDITFKWGDGDTSLLSDTTSSSPTMTMPQDAEPETTYTYTLYVTDSHEETVTATVTITALEPEYKFEIQSPEDGTTYVASECNEAGECRVTVSGVADLALGSDVVVVGDAVSGDELCIAKIVNGTWECDYWTLPGHQNIYASWSTDWVELSIEREYNVVAPLEPNLPPVIVLKNVFTGTAGSDVVLDASGSYDPNPGDKVSYMWSGDALAAVSDMTSNAPVFSIPVNAEPGEVYPLELVATDNHGDYTSAETKVVVIPNEGDSFIQILTPEEGATVNDTKVLISGVATPGYPVFVFDTSKEGDTPICSLKSDNSTGEWACESNFNMGANTVRAELMDAPTVSTVLAKDVRNFIVMTSDEPVPVIESPKTGDTISIRPTISGSVDAKSGEINVWYAIDNGRFVLLCNAEVQTDGTWVCTAGYDLAYSTEYTLRANWKFNEATSNMSEPVVVTTKGPDVADITLISPPDGSVLTTGAVVFAGSAEPGTFVDVYYGSVNDDKLNRVTACLSNSDGYWACPDVELLPGEYVAYADDSSDAEVIASNKVFFTILYPEMEEELPKSGKVRGGSCSMTTTPSNHFGWLALAAAFAGIFFIRRRRA